MSIGWFLAVTIATCYGAAVVSVKLVFEFSWVACAGLRREWRRSGSIHYVSRGIRFPVAVYWLGGSEVQAELVAAAMAAGQLKLEEVSGRVSQSLNWQAIQRGVSVWPTHEARDMFGKPGDLDPESSAWGARVGVA